MNNTYIEDKEYLHRAICLKGLEDYSIFMATKYIMFLPIDEDGISVDRDIGRSDQEIASSFKERFKRNKGYYGSAKFSAKEARELLTLFFKPSPSKRNPYHALILKNENEEKVDLASIIILASITKIYDINESFVKKING